MRELDQLRTIFLADDVDEETREENAEQLAAWDRELRENTAFASWQGDDITQMVVAKVKEEYKEASLLLALSRTLTDDQRYSLWARQDAARWLLSLTQRDAAGTLERLEQEIKAALSVT